MQPLTVMCECNNYFLEKDIEKYNEPGSASGQDLSG